jgi:hypothetical protein
VAAERLVMASLKIAAKSGSRAKWSKTGMP